MKKREIIQKNGICLKCLNGKHVAKDCAEKIKCEKCNSVRHCTAFHIECVESSARYGGENRKPEPPPQVHARCTEISGNSTFKGKSCAKIVLVQVYQEGRPDKSLKCNAFIDDQSNKSLARLELFDSVGNSSESVVMFCCPAREVLPRREDVHQDL